MGHGTKVEPKPMDHGSGQGKDGFLLMGPVHESVVRQGRYKVVNGVKRHTTNGQIERRGDLTLETFPPKEHFKGRDRVTDRVSFGSCLLMTYFLTSLLVMDLW